jgi:hypothetical protein
MSKHPDGPCKASLSEAIPGTDGFWSFEQRYFAEVRVPSRNLRIIRWRGRVFYRSESTLSQSFREIKPSEIAGGADVVFMRSR